MAQTDESVEVPRAIEVEGEAGPDEDRRSTPYRSEMPPETPWAVPKRERPAGCSDQRGSPVVGRREDDPAFGVLCCGREVIWRDGREIAVDDDPRTGRRGRDTRDRGMIEAAGRWFSDDPNARTRGPRSDRRVGGHNDDLEAGTTRGPDHPIGEFEAERVAVIDGGIGSEAGHAVERSNRNNRGGHHTPTPV